MSLLSSQQLVQSVIYHFQRHPEKLGKPPTPIAAEVLDKLTFPDGKPLPPSLKQWLAFDAASLGLFSDLSNLVITPTSISDWGGYAFNTVQRLLLPEHSYNLYPSGGDSMWFLYTGQADEEGEYPVFVADIDDLYYVRPFAPNFGVFLANRHQTTDFNLYRWRDNPTGYRSLFDHPNYGLLMRKQSDLNFQGYQYAEVYGEADTLDGIHRQWCSDEDVKVDLRKQGFDEKTINQLLGIDLSDL